MSPIKLIILAAYAVLAFFALSDAASPLGIWSLRILVVLAALHTLEMLVFYKACQRAGGSLGGHLLSVFLFGVFHMREINKAGGGV